MDMQADVPANMQQSYCFTIRSAPLRPPWSAADAEARWGRTPAYTAGHMTAAPAQREVLAIGEVAGQRKAPATVEVAGQALVVAALAVGLGFVDRIVGGLAQNILLVVAVEGRRRKMGEAWIAACAAVVGFGDREIVAAAEVVAGKAGTELAGLAGFPEAVVQGAVCAGTAPETEVAELRAVYSALDSEKPGSLMFVTEIRTFGPAARYNNTLQ